MRAMCVILRSNISIAVSRRGGAWQAQNRETQFDFTVRSYTRRSVIVSIHRRANLKFAPHSKGGSDERIVRDLAGTGNALVPSRA